MSYFLRIIIISLNIIVTPNSLIADDSICSHDKNTFRCVQYLKNYDGDTVTFNIPNVHPLIGDKISVRVYGLDTPEMKGNGPCEKDAARIAKNLISSTLNSAKRIDLTEVGRDKYFRILANVVADGKSIKDILIKNKLAYPYDGGTKQKVNWCEATKK